MILPIANVLFNLAQFLLTILVFLPVLFIAYHVAPGPQMLAFPVFLLLQVLFIIGAPLILSTATTYFRDVQYLVDVALSVTFWMTPILYEYTLVPERFRFALLLTPMAPFIRASQDVLHYHVWPGLVGVAARNGVRDRHVRDRSQRVRDLRGLASRAGLAGRQSRGSAGDACPPFHPALPTCGERVGVRGHERAGVAPGFSTLVVHVSGVAQRLRSWSGVAYRSTPFVIPGEPSSHVDRSQSR